MDPASSKWVDRIVEIKSTRGEPSLSLGAISGWLAHLWKCQAVLLNCLVKIFWLNIHLKIGEERSEKLCIESESSITNEENESGVSRNVELMMVTMQWHQLILVMTGKLTWNLLKSQSDMLLRNFPPLLAVPRPLLVRLWRVCSAKR